MVRNLSGCGWKMVTTTKCRCFLLSPLSVVCQISNTQTHFHCFHQSYHSEHLVFSKRTYPDPVTLDLSIPAFDPLPNQYYIRIVSDTWVSVELLHPISLRNVKMPDQKTPYTDLIDLTPLPTTALQEPKYEQLYSKFETFNPIQTQLFHTLYHTDWPVFLGAPTGSVRF